MSEKFHYQLMPDGTLKVFNPLVGEQSWTVPGRAGRPITNQRPWNARELSVNQHTDPSCNFCPENLIHTPAEKSRLIVVDGKIQGLDHLLPAAAASSKALFRRVPNLYEIVPWEYWRDRYAVTLNAQQRSFKKAYLSDKQGRQHLERVLGEKLKRLGKTSEEIKAMGESLYDVADAFFGGSHDLIVSGDHYSAQAKHDSDLLASGSLTRNDHIQFLEFSFEAAASLRKNNSKIAWVSVYQNWLAPAGASFDHLHKQVLGLDAVPPSMLHRQALLNQEPNFYNTELLGLIQREKLAVAENDHAIAFVEPGHRYPTLMVISKSRATTWLGFSQDEKGCFSDLLWLCHHLSCATMPVNEEWFHSAEEGPAMPVHALLQWRMNTPAGFEGGSGVYLNPLFPWQLRDRLLNRDHPKISGVRWGQDCASQPGSLAYLG